jgi:ribosomal protein L37AE/L43A
MSQPAPLELYCPSCRMHVQPIQAAGQWFCPHCAWQFSEDDVRHQQGRPAPNGEDSPDVVG